MAHRRLALVALLAHLVTAVAATAFHRSSIPRQSLDVSDSESLDPFSLWDEYEESFEITPRPRPHITKPSAKIILRGKGSKVNATVKNTKGANKKNLIKSTTINIESHTNFLVTKQPPVLIGTPNPNVKRLPKPVREVDQQYLYIDSFQLKHVTRRPNVSRPPTRRTTRRPGTTHRQTTPRPPTTKPRRTTTKKSRTSTTTQRPRNQKKRTTNTFNTNRTPCPPKRSGWLSSFFQNNNKLKKASKKPVKTGFLNKIYDWLWGSNSWFESGKVKRTTTTSTTTTTSAPPTTTSDWFQTLLDSEEDDGAYPVKQEEMKKSAKKPLKKNYKGYQLLRTYPDAQWKVHEMLDLQDEGQGSGLMWWTTPSLNGTTDLLVPPDLLEDVKEHLKSSQIDFDVVIWDLQKAITYENPRLSKKQRLELEHTRGHPMTWRRYHRYADILRYLEYLHHSHSDLVELIPLGRSSEGLPLVGVKIALPPNETKAKDSPGKPVTKKWKLRSRMKPAVWLDGGAHAREWIAPAVATWMIHALVEGEKGLGPEYEILKQADFYIMPVLNPDGYEHSHTHDRLWRKTRSRHTENSDDYFVGWFPWNWGRTECVGVDADRNWDYHWGEQDSSRDPCSENYVGPYPFSEPETRAVSEFMSEHRGQVKVYISLHAYSQAWLVPGSEDNANFADDGDLMEMGKLATAALADLYGTKYQVGTAAEIRQAASGMSHDWAKMRAGIQYSYHVDMRDSFGPYGFLLPGSQIVATARETWQAVKTIVDNIST